MCVVVFGGEGGGRQSAFNVLAHVQAVHGWAVEQESCIIAGKLYYRTVGGGSCTWRPHRLFGAGAGGFDLICNAQRRVSARPSHAPASYRHVECTCSLIPIIPKPPGAARHAISPFPSTPWRPPHRHATALPPEAILPSVRRTDWQGASPSGAQGPVQSRRLEPFEACRGASLWVSVGLSQAPVGGVGRTRRSLARWGSSVLPFGPASVSWAVPGRLRHGWIQAAGAFSLPSHGNWPWAHRWLDTRQQLPCDV